MTITLNKTNFNRIMAACKNHVAKFDSRQTLTQIKMEFRFADQTLTAVALDGFTMLVLHLPCEGTTDCDFLMPVLPATKAILVNITAENGQITVEHVGEARTETYREMPGDFIEWTRVIPTDTPVFRIAVNPVYLERAMASMKGQNASVLLSFVNATAPIKITGGNQTCLVLPVKRDDTDE